MTHVIHPVLSIAQRHEMILKLEENRGQGERQCRWCGRKTVKQSDLNIDKMSIQKMQVCGGCHIMY